MRWVYEVLLLCSGVVPSLGSPNYAIRCRAEQVLHRIADSPFHVTPAMVALRRRSADPEVRARLERVVTTYRSVLDRHTWNTDLTRLGIAWYSDDWWDLFRRVTGRAILQEWWNLPSDDEIRGMIELRVEDLFEAGETRDSILRRLKREVY